MPVKKTTCTKSFYVCLAALVAFVGFAFASPSQAQVLDNNGEVSGLMESVFGADPIYPSLEYVLPFPGHGGTGTPGTQTDLLGIYHNVTLRIFDILTREELDELVTISGLTEMSGLEIFILGEYPNSRCLNFTIYDNHSVHTDTILDIDVEPISDMYTNPYDTIYSEDRFHFDIDQPNYYAVKIRLGDEFVDEDIVDPSCSLSNYNVDVNVLDGTVRHGLDKRWMLRRESGETVMEFEPGYDPGPNHGGHFGVRRYGDRTPDTPIPHLFRPLILLRETSTGCPIPFRYQEPAGELVVYDVPDSVVSNHGFGDHNPGACQAQHVEDHNMYGNQWNGLFWGEIPDGQEHPVALIDLYNIGVYWSGHKPFVAAVNPFLAYIIGRFFYELTPAYNDDFSNPVVGDDPLVLVMHVKFPTEPGFPCDDPGPDGCPGAAGSDLRYWSVSFNDDAGEAVYSFARENVPVIDEETSTASIVFSFLDTQGELHERPLDLDPRFNWVHIPSEYQGENPEAPFNVVNLPLRMQMSDEGDPFTCSCFNVPLGFGEHTPNGVIGDHLGGGFMGDYAPQTVILKLSTLLTYQEDCVFKHDPVGGDCTTTYSPYHHADEWWKLLDLPWVPPE